MVPTHTRLSRADRFQDGGRTPAALHSESGQVSAVGFHAANYTMRPEGRSRARTCTFRYQSITHGRRPATDGAGIEPDASQHHPGSSRGRDRSHITIQLGPTGVEPASPPYQEGTLPLSYGPVCQTEGGGNDPQLLSQSTRFRDGGRTTAAPPSKVVSNDPESNRIRDAML